MALKLFIGEKPICVSWRVFFSFLLAFLELKSN